MPMFDVYEPLTEGFEDGMDQLETVLTQNGVQTVTCNINPMPILEVRSHEFMQDLEVALDEECGEDIAQVFVASLRALLHCPIPGIEQMGIIDDRVGIFERGSNGPQLNYRTPVNAPIGSYNVHAIQGWFKHNGGGSYIPLLVGIFGYTDPAKTYVGGQYDFTKDELSAAFVFQKGLSYPEVAFYNLLGRQRTIYGNSQKIGFELLDRWLKSTDVHRESEFFGRIIPYHAMPFSTPVDAIFYPHTEEFGAQTFLDARYLEGSARAKALIKRYFEQVTNKKLVVEDSLVLTHLSGLA